MRCLSVSSGEDKVLPSNKALEDSMSRGHSKASSQPSTSMNLSQEPGILPEISTNHKILPKTSKNNIKDSLVMFGHVWSVLRGVWFHLVEVCPLFQEFLQCFLPLQDGGHPVLHRTASDGKTVKGGWNSPKSRAYYNMECV